MSVAYKAFGMDMQCRGYQYEVGKTYTHNSEVKLCESGFHACEYPLDVFSYYPPARSQFAIVEQAGNLDRHGNDSKVASESITVKAKIDIADMVKASIEYTSSRCNPICPDSPASATGCYGAASAKGDYGAASATGCQSAASATNHHSAAAATSDRSAASATGYHGAASATGYQSAASATGCQGSASATSGHSAASATGCQGSASATSDHSAASATGYRGAASATGDLGAASATGRYGAASATGECGSASATGYLGAASATGDYSTASADGKQGAASATGKNSAASASGEQSVACGLGCSSKSMAAKHSGAIVLVHRDSGGNIIHIRASKVGENGVKPNVWYSLNVDGEFVEETS